MLSSSFMSYHQLEWRRLKVLWIHSSRLIPCSEIIRSALLSLSFHEQQDSASSNRVWYQTHTLSRSRLKSIRRHFYDFVSKNCFPPVKGCQCHLQAMHWLSGEIPTGILFQISTVFHTFSGVSRIRVLNFGVIGMGPSCNCFVNACRPVLSYLGPEKFCSKFAKKC